MPEQPCLTDDQQKALTEIPAGATIDERALAELIALGLVSRTADGQPALTHLGCVKYLEIVREQEH